MEGVACRLGCAPYYLAFVHLGVPVAHNMSRVSTWSSILDRFQTRLSGWKAKCHSFSGKFTLIKSVIGILGSHLMPIFSAPIFALNSLEALRARFC